jgi:hypothetical protein
MLNPLTWLHDLRAPWLMLMAILTALFVVSCSSPSLPVVTGTRALRPPRLLASGACGGVEGSGSRWVVTNPNARAALRVYWVRQMPDLNRSMTGETEVPPGQSVGIGCQRMHGVRCTYEITGWMEHLSSQTN